MYRKLIIFILASAFICGILPFSALAEGEVNLVAGLGYTVATGEPISKSYENLSVNGLEYNRDEGRLTDSGIATLSQDSPEWYRAYSGQSRIVTFDLGVSCAVSRVEAGFLHSKSAGICAPRYINIYLSDNGTDYELVAEYSDKAAPSSTIISRYNAVIALQDTYSARFIRVEFSVDTHTYCDEICVFGNEMLSGNEKSLRPDEREDNSGYLGAVGDSRDIVKLYNGYYPKDPSVGVLTESEVLPYIAYIDAAGDIAGKMFDSIALVPCDTAYPSGGRLNSTDSTLGAVVSDWELYFENTFTAGQDLDAIDKVAGRVYAILGLKDKLNIYLTVPYPTLLNKAFGDINGDGKAEYCNTLEGRIAVVQWYMDKCIAAFEENAYDNLTLAGFYWYGESIDYSASPHEAELVTAMTGYAGSKRLQAFFSADYLASGFDNWSKLGFDGAVMKSGFAEYGLNGEFMPDMLSEYAVSVYNNHLGAEISTPKTSDFQSEETDYMYLGSNYETHLYYGSKSGYMSALSVYEQDMGPGMLYEFCYADTSTPKGIYLRRLYDLTYRYINGNYINMPPTFSLETDIEIIRGDDQITLDLGINDMDSHWENITVEFPVKPSHGSVTAAAGKKSLIYSVDEDFVGSDSFTVCITDGFNRSEEVTVTVNVTEPVVSIENADISIPLVIPQSNPQNDIPLWLIILLVILAAAMVGVAVVTIAKPKKEE